MVLNILEFNQYYGEFNLDDPYDNQEIIDYTEAEDKEFILDLSLTLFLGHYWIHGLN